ncbi:hypothetical protein CSA56_09985 [candidate division KSB3 bacterium]|uniref:Uncharacterized protein n=1 Tax=candidate division KSB3 bacterium TaxID=2044937 RepID=A0A2G6KFT1_9BACT|nr:MAG: hypothetical protein CSA56_09985 [candidate division KSB3 bacterium]
MRKYVVSIFMFGLLFSILSACSHRGDRHLGPLRQGRALEEEGEYVAAQDHYQKMKEPAFREVCINNLHYLYGDILDAMAAINGEDQPTSEQYYALGEAYYEKARTIPQGVNIEPNAELDLVTYFTQEKAQLQAKALASLEQVQQRQPDHTEALFLEGTVYEEQEEPEKAIAVYQDLLHHDPGNPEALLRLSRLFYQQGSYQKSLKLAERVVAFSPTNPEAHFVLGNIYSQQGQLDLALDEFHQTLCLEPRYQEAYYRIGQYFLAQNNLIEAERVIKLGAVNNPDSVQMGIFYTGLKSVLDQQEQDDVLEIIQQLEGQDISSDLQNVNMADQNIPVQLRYYELRLKLLKRQRPYHLTCSETEEHPFFERQIIQTENKIHEIQEFLTSIE